MCKEAHTRRDWGGNDGVPVVVELKSAPFTLGRVLVETPDKKRRIFLPVNSSIKRTAMSYCLANAANIPGSVRKTESFKKAVKSIYEGVGRAFEFKFVIRTNKMARLLNVTNPIDPQPARQIITDLRHVASTQKTSRGMYYNYISILFEARII